MKIVLRILVCMAISVGNIVIGQGMTPRHMLVESDDISYTLVVHLASGQQVGYLLADQPHVTFRGDELLITTHMNQISYLSADVKKFTYRDANSNIADVLVPQCLFSFTGDRLVVIGLEPESELLIYEVGGQLIASAQVDENCEAIVNLVLQPGQTYIAKTSFANFKITKP